MNKSKKLLALILTMLLAVSMLGTLSTAMAAEGEATTYTITITPTDSVAHTYEAYQIFSGEVVANEDNELELWGLAWGDGINSDNFLTALKASNAFGTTNPFANAATANDVAEVLMTISDDSEQAIAFASIAEANLTTTVAGTSAKDGDSYKIANLSGGYYLVKDQDGSLANVDESAYTRYILKLVGDVSVDAKAVIPTLDKAIVEDEGNVDANTASVGDDVSYVLTSKVPDMTGYATYTYKITDTLSKGLSFKDDVAITIGATILTEDTDYTVTSVAGDNDTTVITITFTNFISYKDQKGADISVTYSAKLTSDVDMTQVGNTNTAKLTYSNNPGDSSSASDTTEVEVTTYTTSVKLTKIDGDTQETLTGAEFSIAADNNGAVGDVIASGAVDANGVINFTGLGEGTYWITETKAPDGGYNALENPIKLVISATATNDSCTWTATADDKDLTYDGTNYVIPLTVANNKGTLLPSTGGIGTTIFYIAGGVLVAAAVVYMITKKRMENSEK